MQKGGGGSLRGEKFCNGYPKSTEKYCEFGGHFVGSYPIRQLYRPPTLDESRLFKYPYRPCPTPNLDESGLIMKPKPQYYQPLPTPVELFLLLRCDTLE